MQPLPLAFYARPADEVALSLLGRILAHRVEGTWRAGRIVETEAYMGPHDLACHSSKGRTKRTEVMFGPAGFSYVYLIYGMHHCFNVVTGDGAAVLIRAVEPVTPLPHSSSGPGRTSKALGFTRAHNALSLASATLRIEAGTPVAPDDLGNSARIGVDYAGAWAAAKLRFFVRSSRWVSGTRFGLAEGAPRVASKRGAKVHEIAGETIGAKP